MKLIEFGVIGSAGGSALKAAIKCMCKTTSLKPYIVVDRQCGLWEWAKINKIENKFIDYASKKRFSEDVNSYFDSVGVSRVIMYYSRLVEDPLLKEKNMYNIHPSLLPAYSGISAVKQAKDAAALVLGASLHCVDEGVDTGKLCCQVATKNLRNYGLVSAQSISFLQKTWLTINWIEDALGLRLEGGNFSSSEYIHLCTDPIRSKSTYLEFLEIEKTVNIQNSAA
jgi:phosphoribosylglycinamide formyltransferase-1